MIGQLKLINKLNSYNIDTFPRSVMLVGEKGIGKHTVANYLRDNIIKLPLIDMTENLSDEYIDQVYRNPNPAIYMINISDIVEKTQNVILKFLEEPPNNAFIIILAEHRNLVLNTVLNRCVIFEFESYSKSELLQFVPEGVEDKSILEILKTPGKLLNTNLKTYKEGKELCNKIITKMHLASFPNALSIAGKINYKDEYDKIDLELLFDLLCFSLVSSYKENNNIKLLEMYLLTRDFRESLLDKRVNKQLLFENYLSELWMLVRGE